MKIFRIIPVALAFATFFLAGCSSTKETPPEVVPVFAKGADVGWVTEMESKGIKFYDAAGNEKELMVLLKSLGINSIRLRAWVNPQKGWNNTKDLVVKAKRAKDLGMTLMIDFHYSDDWADPAKQPMPKAWSKMDYDKVKKALYDYTAGVMDTLKMNGITPEWVQVGNETNDGMMWEMGRASSSMANFAGLITSGYNAIKSVSPETKVIVHLSNGYDNKMFRWMFDGLKANKAPWDIIGMSVYPYWSPTGAASWKTINEQALENMKDMITRYGTPVMVVEAGSPASDPEMSKLYLTDLIQKTKSLDKHMGLGVFYWEPECYSKFNDYPLGAFNAEGKPTIAMDAFAD